MLRTTLALAEVGHRDQGLLHHLWFSSVVDLALSPCLLGSGWVLTRGLPHCRRRPPLEWLSAHDEQATYLLGACIRRNEHVQLLQLVKHSQLPLILVPFDDVFDLTDMHRTQGLANIRARGSTSTS